MGEIGTVILLLLGCAAAVVLTAVRLPGTWLIVAGAAVWGWSEEWQRISVAMLAALAGLALVGEAVELSASVFTARHAGASRQAAWGGLVGGILGMFFLSLPMPIVGTLLGAVLGCFLGAAVIELAVRKRVAHGARVGVFAALGCAVGTAGKVAIALLMSGLLVAITLWPTASAGQGGTPLP